MLDLFIIVVILWALISGWRNGFARELASSAGYLVGLLVAASCYSNFGEFLAVNGSESNMFTSVVAFFILWIITPIALGLAANIFTRFLEHIHLGGLNSFAGAIVSTFKFTVLLSCALSAMSALHILNEERTEDSILFSPVKGVFSTVVDWVMHDDVKKIEPADRAAVSGDTTWVEVKH